MTKLNIGCGTDIKKGYINIDTHKENGADLIHKLPDKLPFEDNSVDEIYCSHVLEDFGYEYIDIMKDFHRVLKKSGILHIRVPYGLSVGNPHHVRFFDETSFSDFIYKDKIDYAHTPKFSKMVKLKINRISIFDQFVTRTANNHNISIQNNSEGIIYKTLRLLYKLTMLKKCEVEVILKK